jgi:hypothetical protein
MTTAFRVNRDTHLEAARGVQGSLTDPGWRIAGQGTVMRRWCIFAGGVAA